MKIQTKVKLEGNKNLWLEDKIEKKNRFNKRKQIKWIRTKLEKKIHKNLDWRMKLITSKTFTKRSGNKVKWKE
jgi:hypothetical protein